MTHVTCILLTTLVEKLMRLGLEQDDQSWALFGLTFGSGGNCLWTACAYFFVHILYLRIMTDALIIA